MSQLVEPDGRRRAALDRLGKPEHNLYLVDEEPDGTLIFTLAVVMSAHEAALLRNLDLVAQIEADQADPSRAVRSEARRCRSE